MKIVMVNEIRCANCGKIIGVTREQETIDHIYCLDCDSWVLEEEEPI